MAKKKVETLRVTQVKSAIGRLKNHQDCLRGLGLRRVHHTVEVAATPENLGMVNKISYMLKVEEA